MPKTMKTKLKRKRFRFGALRYRDRKKASSLSIGSLGIYGLFDGEGQTLSGRDPLMISSEIRPGR
jgi:hypothetical protein